MAAERKAGRGAGEGGSGGVRNTGVESFST